MLISIITVCYNSKKYICSAIESVLAQTYPNIEYIVIDGASKDNTIDVIKKYEPKFNGRMKWVSEPDKGIYDAMNKGILMATGEIIGILNSDDFYIDNSVIADIVSVFESKKTDSVFADIYCVDDQDTQKITRIGTYKNLKRIDFYLGWLPGHPGFFVKKEIYDKYGLFDLSYKLAADYDLLLRFLFKNSISSFHLKRFILKMRAGGASQSMKNFKKIKKEEILIAFKNFKILFIFPFSFKLFRKLMYKVNTKING